MGAFLLGLVLVGCLYFVLWIIHDVTTASRWQRLPLPGKVAAFVALLIALGAPIVGVLWIVAVCVIGTAALLWHGLHTFLT